MPPIKSPETQKQINSNVILCQLGNGLQTIKSYQFYQAVNMLNVHQPAVQSGFNCYEMPF